MKDVVGLLIGTELNLYVIFSNMVILPILDFNTLGMCFHLLVFSSMALFQIALVFTIEASYCLLKVLYLLVPLTLTIALNDNQNCFH